MGCHHEWQPFGPVAFSVTVINLCGCAAVALGFKVSLMKTPKWDPSVSIKNGAFTWMPKSQCLELSPDWEQDQLLSSQACPPDISGSPQRGPQVCLQSSISAWNHLVFLSCPHSHMLLSAAHRVTFRKLPFVAVIEAVKENEAQPNKCGDLIGFMKWFMNQAAFSLATRRAPLRGCIKRKVFVGREWD